MQAIKKKKKKRPSSLTEMKTERSEKNTLDGIKNRLNTAEQKNTPFCTNGKLSLGSKWCLPYD